MTSTVAEKRDGEIDLIDFLESLWNSRVTIAVVTIVCALVSVYLALSATPIYQANAIVVRADDRDLSAGSSLAGQLGGLVGMSLDQGGRARKSQEILESRKLVEDFIRRNDILTELSPSDGEQLTLWRAVKVFREIVLDVREDSTTGVTTISVEWMDPVTAARWANDFVALANELIRTRDRDEAERNIKYLRNQIEQTNVVALQTVMYNLIEAETKTVMLTNVRGEYAFSVVDPAVVSELRVKPRRKLMVISGTAAGLFLGVLVAFALGLVRQIRLREPSKRSQ